MRFCHQCGAEYRRELTHCSDCGAALADNPPPADPRDDGEERRPFNWQVAAEMSGRMQAELMQGALEGEGIPVLIKEAGLPSVYFGHSTFAAVLLLVPAERLEEAKGIIAALQDEDHRQQDV